MDILALANLALNGASLVSSLLEKGSNLVGATNSSFAKGMRLIKEGIEVGKDVAPVVTAMINTFTDGKTDITPQELKDLEALLDAEIEDYLTPMKPRTA